MPPKKAKIETDKSEQSEVILRGEEAKKLLACEYFLGVVERQDGAYRDAILSLKPSDTARFTGLQERRQALHDLRGSIIGDSELGRKALAQLQGEETKKGRVA